MNWKIDTPLKKVTYRISTEMYAYVEIEDYVSLEFTEEQIAQQYEEYSKAFRPKPKNELPRKEWNQLLDNYLHGKGFAAEVFEKLSPFQADLIHELDKAFNRNGFKNNE